MKLNDSHIQSIQLYLEKFEIDPELNETLTDHICCLIEESDKEEFEAALSNALSEFDSFNPTKIQESIIYLSNFKKEISMKKTLYIMSYISSILIISGFLFKMMHWHSANVQIVLGVALLNFGVLPIYFIGRYRKAMNA